MSDPTQKVPGPERDAGKAVQADVWSISDFERLCNCIDRLAAAEIFAVCRSQEGYDRLTNEDLAASAVRSVHNIAVEQIRFRLEQEEQAWRDHEALNEREAELRRKAECLQDGQGSDTDGHPKGAA